MPKLKEWAGIALLLAVMLYPSLSKADPKLGQESLEYCVHRGRLAIGFVNSVQQGFAIENVNVAWPTAPEDEGIAAARDEWVNILRAEVKRLMAVVKQDEHFAERVGQMVAEKCAFQYGAGRVGRKVNYIETASSQLVIPGVQKEMLCKHRATIAFEIASMRTTLPKKEFLRLNPLPEHWSDAQKAEVLQLVDDAYAWEQDPWDFGEKTFKECMR